MSNLKIRMIWQDSYDDYCQSGHFQSKEQKKTSRAILACKSGRLGFNVSECSECGHMEFHKNSCRNRNCPICQAVLKEIWVDQRRAEVKSIVDKKTWIDLPMRYQPYRKLHEKMVRFFLK